MHPGVTIVNPLCQGMLVQESEEGLREAVRVLRRGGIVAYPTDTLYALGADATSEDAVMRLYRLKRRPLSKPISAAFSSIEMVRRYCTVTPEAEKLMRRFLPGELTLLLPFRGLPRVLSAGMPKLAVRIPGSATALRLIEMFSKPVTATSANISGEPPAKSAEEVIIEGVEVVIATEEPLSGVATTIYDPETGRVLRRGSISPEEIEACLRE